MTIEPDARDRAVHGASRGHHCGGGRGSSARTWWPSTPRIGAEASVGPFALLRPGTLLERGAKAGTFVELKNAELGERAKVPHLSYIGDAEIGAGTNVGAGAHHRQL